MLIDIGIENEHTFWVSDKPNGPWYLTHNSMPDIDSDFSDREQAIELISEHFGKENVIPISNFNQLKMRSLVKDLCRLNGVPFDEVNAYTKNIESEAMAEAKKLPGFDRQLWSLTFDEAKDKSVTFQKLMRDYPDLEENIKVLFKQMRNVSRHAGGVIITEEPGKHMPLIKSGGVMQTPWQEGLNFRHLEGLGLLKFDILGLGTLRIFENCIRRILKKEGNKYPTFNEVKDWFYTNLHPDNNEMDDQHVYKHVYADGRWAGIFQFVQPPVQKFVKKLKPKSILDLSIATSIFRPGPLAISADKLYLNNRNNPESVVYKHPLLEQVTGDTAGLILFQEQLQLIYNKMAGVPLEETDGVRKAFNKKDMSNKDAAAKEIRAMREDFAEKCLEANDVKKTISYSIFDEMEKFVAYSFNKSLAGDTRISTYTETGEFITEKTIENILPGEFVKTRDENLQSDVFTKIISNHDHGDLEVIEYQFDNGKTVRCTSNHKFRVLDGRMLTINQILEQGLEVVFE